jgi:hypothetical protein
MINPEIKKILEGVNSTPFGRALREYLEDELSQIKDVENATSWEDALGRKHAGRIIRKVFSFLGIEKKEEKTKNNYE